MTLAILPALAFAQTSPAQGHHNAVFSQASARAPVSQGRVHAKFQAPPASAPVKVQPWEAIVSTRSGRIRGQNLGDGTYAFKAIPFAAPPVGDLRWAAPRDPAPWDGVRERTESAPACLQNDYGWQNDKAAASSEDCLYLELRTPSIDPEARKPVIVWLHGGANRAGDGAGTIMAGFAAKDVVIVSVQYRLGVFGFLSHPALTKEGGGASGNYALMDQIKALQWVQANIAGFGGDPYNITIAGHSAGAQDVGLLLASPLARGLFHKAIMESGTPQFGFAPRTLKQNEVMGVALAKGFVTAGHKPGSAAALADLRAADARALQAAGDKLKAPMEDQGFIWDQATIDGRILPRAPEDIFHAGEGSRVPLIIGVSARELTLSDISGNFDKAMQTRFGADAERVTAMLGDDPLLGDRGMQISSDIMLRCPADWIATKMTAAGSRAWLYQLDVDNGGTIHHGSELNFVMNARPAGKSDADWPPLLDHWIRFAKTGDPNGKDLPKWPVYGAGHNYMAFATTGPKARDHIRADTCALLDRP